MNVALYSSRIRLSNVFLFVILFSAFANLLLYSSFGFYHVLYILGALAVFFADFCVRVIRPQSQSECALRVEINNGIFTLFKFVSWLGLLVVIYVVHRYGFGAGFDGNPINSIRHAKTADHMNFFGLGHFGLISLSVSFVLKLQGYRRNSWTYFLISITASLASAERTSLLYAFVLYFGLDFVLNYRFTIKKAILPVLIIVVLFTFIAHYTNKLFDEDGFVFLFKYFSYPLEALINLNTTSINMPLSNVFGVLAKPYEYIFISDIYVPDDSGLFNVYSYLYRPLATLGLYGFILIMLALGLFFYFVEYMSSRSVGFLALNLSLLFSTIIAFYDWTFNLTTHIYVFTIVCFMTARVRI